MGLCFCLTMVHASMPMGRAVVHATACGVGAGRVCMLVVHHCRTGCVCAVGGVGPRRMRAMVLAAVGGVGASPMRAMVLAAVGGVGAGREGALVVHHRRAGRMHAMVRAVHAMLATFRGGGEEG